MRQSHVSQLITLCEELAHRHQRMPDAAEFWDDEARALSWDLASIRASIR